MKYGKIIQEEAFFEGNLTSVKQWVEESISIPDKEHLLTEMLAGMDLILGHNTNELSLTITRNKEGKLRLVKRHLKT